jgi:hypothetical protein
MKKRWFLALAAMFFVSGLHAHAGFVFTYTVDQAQVQGQLRNVFRFYARNDQQGDQAGSKSLLAISVHLKPVGLPLVFNFQDLDGDTVPDADVFGKDQTVAAITGSFVRVGTHDDWLAAWVRPVGDRSKNTGLVPTTAYANVTDLWIEGFSQNKALDATAAPGQFYAAAVAPLGVDINVVGKVAAEKGGIVSTLDPADPLTPQQLADQEGITLELATLIAQQGAGPSAAAADGEIGSFYDFSFTAQAPEPSTTALLAAGAAGLLSRRRRRPGAK